MIAETVAIAAGGWPGTAKIFGVGGLVHLALFAAVALHCLSHKRDSRTTILWLFFAWGFPIIGSLAYGAFGVSHVPHIVELIHALADIKASVAITASAPEYLIAPRAEALLLCFA